MAKNRCNRFIYGKQCKRECLPNSKYCDKHQQLFKNQTFSIGSRTFVDGSRAVNYQEYIDSDSWKERARAARERAGNSCSLCHCKGKLHVHHNTYVRLGNERPEDLTVLCESCHKLFHKFYEYDGQIGYFVPKSGLKNLLRKIL